MDGVGVGVVEVAVFVALEALADPLHVEEAEQPLRGRSDEFGEDINKIVVEGGVGAEVLARVVVARGGGRRGLVGAGSARGARGEALAPRVELRVAEQIAARSGEDNTVPDEVSLAGPELGDAGDVELEGVAVRQLAGQDPAAGGRGGG